MSRGLGQDMPRGNFPVVVTVILICNYSSMHTHNIEISGEPKLRWILKLTGSLKIWDSSWFSPVRPSRRWDNMWATGYNIGQKATIYISSCILESVQAMDGEFSTFQGVVPIFFTDCLGRQFRKIQNAADNSRRQKTRNERNGRTVFARFWRSSSPRSSLVKK